MSSSLQPEVAVDRTPETVRPSAAGRVGSLRGHLAANAARDFEAGAHLQDFLVTAVAAILLTRLFLGLTGYPQVGGRGLHVAHLLWGGLLMLLALVLLLAAVGRVTKRAAAIVGGIGFGLFVDEIGKFVTADNNYFFQPAIALIYSLLIGLFLLFRAIERRSLTPEEALANAADMVRELVLGGATPSEVARALSLLELSGAHGPLADGLRAAVAGAARTNERPPSWAHRAAVRAWHIYGALLAWRWFRRAVLTVFALQALWGASLVLVMLATFLGGFELRPSVWPLALPGRSLVVPGSLGSPLGPAGAMAEVATSAASLACALAGVAWLHRSRLVAYRWLERSVLVGVFFGQVLLFWEDQLAAVGQLAWNLLLLAALRYAIRQEDARHPVASRAVPAGPEAPAVPVASAASPTGLPPTNPDRA